MKNSMRLLAVVAFGCLLAGGRLLGQDTNPAHYTRPVPQCAHYEWDRSDFYIVNSCNIKIQVYFDSDGAMWGETSVQPGQRQAEEINGIFSRREQGTISLFPCPNDSQPVMPNGGPIWDRHYHGGYTCYVGAQG